MCSKIAEKSFSFLVLIGFILTSGLSAVSPMNESFILGERGPRNDTTLESQSYDSTLVSWGNIYASQDEHLYLKLRKSNGTEKEFVLFKKKNPALYNLAVDFLTGIISGRYPALTLRIVWDEDAGTNPRTFYAMQMENVRVNVAK